MIALGSSVRLTASFLDTDSELVDAISVTVSITDSTDAEVDAGSATHSSTGVYYYDWTPGAEGSYIATFTGTFADGTATVVAELDVDDSETTATPSTTQYLGDDFEIVFSSGYDPMLADPEYLLPMFSGEVSLVEISELIHKYSVEVEGWLGTVEPFPEVYDYVVAATLCALGRRYNGLMDGLSSATSVMLGDLQVMQSGGGSAKYVVNRGSASSWCEYAELLRRLIKNTVGGGMTSAVKAGAWVSPIQDRTSRLIRVKRGGRRCGSTNLWDRDRCD